MRAAPPRRTLIMGMCRSAMLLNVLLVVVALGHIGVNAAFLIPAGGPPFLIAENFAVAAAFLALAFRPYRIAVLLLSGFLAGRISTSVVTSTGSLAPLAMEHLPVLLLLLAIAGMSAMDLARGRRA